MRGPGLVVVGRRRIAMAEMDLPPSTSGIGRLRQRLLGGRGLAARGRRASVWVLVGFGSRKLIALGSNLALARLLSPEIFGLMALAQVFLQGIKMLSDVGTKASVVRSENGENPDFLNTAWSVQVVRGFIVAAITCLLAWPASRLYDQPVLFPLICVISITAIFSGFTSISMSMASRKMMLKRITLLGLAVKLLIAFVTIVAAWQLQSVWALVVGGLLGSALHLAVSHLFLPPFAHRFQFEPAALRELVTFGRWILLATACTFLASQGQQAIYGLLIPLEILGKIAVATLIASVPLALFSGLLKNVVFPSFSEIRRNRPDDIPRVLRKVRLTVIFTFLPLMFVVSYFSQPVIDLLYDDRYVLAGLFLALIPLNNAISILTNPYQNLLLADGASHLHAFLMALAAVLTTAGIVLGYFSYGVIGSVAGVGLAFSLHFVANSVVAHRRGYGTGLLDVLALGFIGLFYSYTLMTLEIPESLWLAAPIPGQG
jgi:O-antigen/teichoic acid export membrane protein